jgi:hypothetical protein
MKHMKLHEIKNSFLAVCVRTAPHYSLSIDFGPDPDSDGTKLMH